MTQEYCYTLCPVPSVKVDVFIDPDSKIYTASYCGRVFKGLRQEDVDELIYDSVVE